MTCDCGQQCSCRVDNDRLANALKLVIDADDMQRQAARAREQALLTARSALALKIGDEANDES